MANGSDPAAEEPRSNGVTLEKAAAANGNGGTRHRGHKSNGIAHSQPGAGKGPERYRNGFAKEGSAGAELNARTMDLGNEPWPLSRYFRWEFLLGAALSLNFLAFWAVPIAFQGQLWHLVLKPFLQPVYDAMDRNRLVRHIAENYIYSKPKYADFFVTFLMVCVSTLLSVSALFAIQWRLGYLPWYAVLGHYFAWVGFGGRMMGAAYSLAHREGHTRTLYQRWIRESVGNICENWLGLFYGNIPYNFTTSHIQIHHKTNASAPDTFYMWDWPRDSLKGFMLFVTRIFMHMIGISSMRFFHVNKQQAQYDKMRQGVITYFVWTPLAILLLTKGSFSFLFWVWFQPLCCMTYFLALINVGFHAFIEFDDEGKHITCVNSSAIVGGEDDYFGEDNHMAHHYSTATYWRDLDEWDTKQLEEWKWRKASVFKNLSIVELSILILVNQWDRVIDHFVDHSGGDMSREDIKDMLVARCRRIESPYEAYQAGPAANPVLKAGNYTLGQAEVEGGL